MLTEYWYDSFSQENSSFTAACLPNESPAFAETLRAGRFSPPSASVRRTGRQEPSEHSGFCLCFEIPLYFPSENLIINNTNPHS